MSWFCHRKPRYSQPNHSPKKITRYEQLHGPSWVHESQSEPETKSVNLEKDQKKIDTHQKIN